VSVLRELMKFDKSVVISSRNRITDSTPLHIATEGGHYDVVKMLMDAGASASDENKVRRMKPLWQSVLVLLSMLYSVKCPVNIGKRKRARL